MQTKIIVLSKNQIISMAQFGALLAVAVLAPLLHSQLITGTIVNAVLFLATATLGWTPAIAIGALPSLVAAMAGTLPSPLIPMIPFIITGNIILVMTLKGTEFLSPRKELGSFRASSFFLGAISASILKFLFLYATSATLFQFILPQKLAPQIAAMMSWPQLTTALLGGLLAFIFLRIYKNKNADRNL
ncbi:MAG: iron hydrogenase [Candidatus Gribaldobacteria bacterium]|nr:iron hydrogenase [Candidatus Gribaldobacteria bacterium]